MNDFINKLEFKQISKEVKDLFIELMKENNIVILKSQFIPIYKSFFQGKVYFSDFLSLTKAKKLLILAKEKEQENFKKYLETERNKLNN